MSVPVTRQLLDQVKAGGAVVCEDPVAVQQDPRLSFHVIPNLLQAPAQVHSHALPSTWTFMYSSRARRSSGSLMTNSWPALDRPCREVSTGVAWGSSDET